METVVSHYFKNALFIALDFALAYRFAYFLEYKYPKLLTEKFLAILLIASSFCLLIAGIGKVGWAIQTWPGDTSNEIFDQVIFLCLSYFGGFLLFTSLISTILTLKKKP